MSTTIGKVLRLAEFWQEGQKSLLIDATLPGALGPMPGMDSPAETVERLAPLADGLIVNPGLAELHADRFVGKLGAAPLIRLDWTNVHRPADFALPLRVAQRIPLASPTDAIQIGGSAAVVSFLLGFAEEFEARNVQSISFAARDCARVSLPLLVDVQLVGPKIDPAKFDSAVQMGVAFMIEAGADGIFLPLPDAESLRLLLDFSPVPLFIKVDTVDELNAKRDALMAALAAGIAGLVLGSHVLAGSDDLLLQTKATLQKASLQKVQKVAS